MLILNGRTVQQIFFFYKSKLNLNLSQQKSEQKKKNTALLGCDKFFTVKV